MAVGPDHLVDIGGDADLAGLDHLFLPLEQVGRGDALGLVALGAGPGLVIGEVGAHGEGDAALADVHQDPIERAGDDVEPGQELRNGLSLGGGAQDGVAVLDADGAAGLQGQLIAVGAAAHVDHLRGKVRGLGSFIQQNGLVAGAGEDIEGVGMDHGKGPGAQGAGQGQGGERPLAGSGGSLHGRYTSCGDGYPDSSGFAGILFLRDQEIYSL